jgi:hypothetical protein
MNSAALFRWVFLLALLGALGAVARWYPGVIQDGRQAVVTWLHRIMPQKPPTEPRESGMRIYDQGGSLIQANEYMRLALQKTPDDPLARIYHSNILALSKPAPSQVVRLGVVYPQGKAAEVLAAAAAGQESLNRRGGVSGKPILLILGEYAPGMLQRRLDTMAAGLDSRKEKPRGGGTPPEAILVYCDPGQNAAELKSPLPLFFQQAANAAASQQLPADRPWPIAELRSLAGERRVLSATMALVKELETAGLETAEFSGSSDGALVVARPDDLTALQVQHGALVVLVEREDQLPPAQEWTGAQALVRFSPVQPSEFAAELSAGKPELARLLAIDALLWMVQVHSQPKLRDLDGSTVTWNKEGKPVPMGWTLVRATPAGWRTERTLEVAP